MEVSRFLLLLVLSQIRKGAISGDVQLTSLSGTYCGMRQSLICTARNTLDVEVFISDLPLQRISFNGDSEIRVNDHYFITVTEKVLQVINTITTVNFTVMIEYTVDKDTNTDKINCTADACSASERVTLDSGDCTLPKSDFNIAFKSNSIIEASWSPPNCDGWRNIKNYTVTYHCPTCVDRKAEHYTTVNPSIDFPVAAIKDYVINVTATNLCDETTVIYSYREALTDNGAQVVKSVAIIYVLTSIGVLWLLYL